MTRYFGAHTLQGEWHSLLPRYLVLQDRVADKQILDIGCGTGIGSSLLLEMGAQGVNGIDHRPEVLELARIKHAKQGLNFQVMFWEELEFPENAFDMVLCLDPSAPVTDPSLLLEIKRVLRPGGEYVCAIERRNVSGFESLLPRYGYDTTGEEVPLIQPGERVPQIGKLDDLFDTVIPIVQRPRYSFVFDRARRQGEGYYRHPSQSPDDSGMWIGDGPGPAGSAEGTDHRNQRWVETDDRLVDRGDEPAAIELLFCGDEHMAPPTLREIEMPYHEVVERLNQLFSELQLRQHPATASQSPEPEPQPKANPFEDREPTSEFEAVNRSADLAAPPQQHSDTWQQVHRQLDEMNRMYRHLRDEMESLFAHTRRELAERDRYIEQLVETVHRWKHDVEPGAPDTAPVEPAASPVEPAASGEPTGDSTDTPGDDFERQPTSIFRRPGNLPGSQTASDSEDDVDELERRDTTRFNPNLDAAADDDSDASLVDDSDSRGAIDEFDVDDTDEEPSADADQPGDDGDDSGADVDPGDNGDDSAGDDPSEPEDVDDDSDDDASLATDSDSEDQAELQPEDTDDDKPEPATSGE